MRPTTPLTVSLRISGGSITKSCLPNAAARPMEVGAIVTVVVVLYVAEHTTVTGRAVVVTIT